jgi:hypothetical protein
MVALFSFVRVLLNRVSGCSEKQQIAGRGHRSWTSATKLPAPSQIDVRHASSTCSVQVSPLSPLYAPSSSKTPASTATAGGTSCLRETADGIFPPVPHASPQLWAAMLVAKLRVSPASRENLGRVRRLALLGRRHQSSNRAINLPALRQIDASHPPCPSHQPIRIHRFVFEGTAPVPYCSMRSRSSTCCVEIAPPPPPSSPSSPNAPSLSPHADRAPHQPQFPREIARFRLRPVDTIPTRRDGSRRLSVGAFAPTNCPHPPPRGGSADAAGCVA